MIDIDELKFRAEIESSAPAVKQNGLDIDAIKKRMDAEMQSRQPEPDRLSIWESLKYNFIAPKIDSMSPNMQTLLKGIAQRANKDVGETYSGSQTVQRAISGAQEQIKKPENIGELANNLVQGGAIAVISMPAFVASVMANPLGTAMEMGEWAGDITDKSIGALTYAALESISDPITGESLRDVSGIPDDQVDVLRKDFEYLVTNPVEPLMLFMLASGMATAA